jgi:molybdate transport system ATP-binding protein
MIEIDVALPRQDLAIDVRFTAPSDGVTALFGRSGAGKSSIVEMLAGLLRPTRGRIVVDGRVLFDSVAGIDVAPERRRLGYVFQEGRLFPHLSVAANLDYGRRRAPRGEPPIDRDAVIEVLGLAALLARRPQALSGGEKQRVAVGRALLANPRLVLMDEPLASLDAGLKSEILPFLERLRAEIAVPVIYVSHAMEEIIRLADMLVLISQGSVAACGPVEDVLSRLDLRPLTGRYEAGAVISATVAGSDADFDLTHLAFPGGMLRVARIGLAPGARLRVRIRARDVALALSPPADTSFLNIFRGRIEEIGADIGTRPEPQIDVRLDIGVPLWARITRRSVHDLDLAPGREVYALVKAVAIDRQSLGLRRSHEADA